MAEPWTPGPWEVAWSREIPDDWWITARVDGIPRAMPATVADARLIAAAPEMAAWLNLATAWSAEAHFDVIQDGARALLARIRGEA